jgi:Transposase DDE domain
MRENALGIDVVERFVHEAAGEDMHAARVMSLANAVQGVLHAGALGVTTIGKALAQARGLMPRSGVKQVDRLLSNCKLNVWELFASWVPHVVGGRSEIVVALDWTDFDDDDQTTICLNLLTTHGRATPLVWQTLTKSGLKGNRADAEDLVLLRLKEVLPAHVEKVTVLADRAFGDVKLYDLLANELQWKFVIRFRGCIGVERADGETRRAEEWLHPTGRAVLLRNARVTERRHLLPAVVAVRQKGMKEAWYLASNIEGVPATTLIKLYGRRFTIEENFRDAKDWRFGMGLVHVRIGECDRRDRMLLISAMAVVMLTLLGAASEATGLDRELKVNTVKHRTHSLFSQGVYYYGALPMMKEHKALPLIAKFDELIRAVPFFREVYGLV